MSRSTESALSRASSSSRTGWNLPSVRSSSFEAAMGCLRRLLGVIITRGRWSSSSSAWARSRWKYWAAVVRLATRMFSCAASCKKRSRRALGTLALVTVWQEEDELGGLAPLRLPAHDELVDHGLTDVGEVPVLGLPEDQSVVRVDRVAVLEDHERDLRERAVVHGERGPGLRDVVQRHVLLA